MWLIVTDPNSVVCLSVTVVSPAKTAEPIEMPFGLWTLVGPRNHVLDGVKIAHVKGQFLGKVHAGRLVTPLRRQMHWSAAGTVMASSFAMDECIRRHEG